MTPTNMITAKNQEYMAMHIYNMVGYFNTLESMFMKIEEMMQMFEYENEMVETYVFSIIKENCRRKL